MKKTVCVVGILLAAMLLVPLSAMKKDTAPIFAAASKTEVNIPKAKDAVSDSFRVLDSASGNVTEMKSEDYIFGVVAAEMPALYNEEALKAQSVAAYTYACYKRAENSQKSYDISTDHTVDQSYISESAVRERWGDKADEYAEKIKKAIRDTSGYMITCKGAPILAVYHAISTGKTESAKNVWGGDYSYLKPVDSSGDLLSPNYASTVSLTAEETASKLSEICEVSGEAANYFGKSEKTESGNVKEISVCGKTVKGARIRSLLNLRSDAFDVKYEDGKFTFTVRGYGHGVGMSQYGADYMAKQGSDFKEILTHYYTDCTVERVK